MTDRKPHILHVTEETYLDSGEPVTERDYTLTCPGVSGHCRRYEPCKEPDCTVPAEYQHHSRDALGHGQHHLFIDLTWMAATDRCLYVAHDKLPDAAVWLNLPAGDHPVDVDYVGDGDIELVVIDEGTR